MAEFVLDQGSKAKEFRLLDQFTQAYITAAFWTEAEELGDKCLDDLSLEAWIALAADCSKFQLAERRCLAKAASADYGDDQAGHDFWLTRNRHGAGFWDRGLGGIGTELTQAAQAFGEAHLYVGDDGLIYHG